MSSGQNSEVYILTNFSTYLKSFSPIIVVTEQVKMLKRAGYLPILVVSDGWAPPEDSPLFDVDTRFLSNFNSHDAEERFEDIDAFVEQAYKELKAILPWNAKVITHDLIFLPDYTVLNLAARALAGDVEGIRWLHWVHSATGPGRLAEERAMYGEAYANTLHAKFPNSLICYPNAQDIPRVAKNFGYEEFEVIEVPHSTDPTEGMHPLVQRLYDEKKLGDAEVLMVYPLRFDRGKNPDMNVRIIGALNEIGISSHLVFCDFQSTGGDKIVYKDECRALAERLGVSDRVTFLSEFDDMASMEVSHETILDLLTLSNVFCLPSRSETYSLVAQEAMLRGNLVILNQDFPAFRQIYGKKALYRQFNGSEVAFDGFDGTTSTTHSDIDGYFRDRIAKPLLGWMQNDKLLAGMTWVRTQRNPDYVFRNFVEPLLMIGGGDE